MSSGQEEEDWLDKAFDSCGLLAFHFSHVSSALSPVSWILPAGIIAPISFCDLPLPIKNEKNIETSLIKMRRKNQKKNTLWTWENFLAWRINWWSVRRALDCWSRVVARLGIGFGSKHNGPCVAATKCDSSISLSSWLHSPLLVNVETSERTL